MRLDCNPTQHVGGEDRRGPRRNSGSVVAHLRPDDRDQRSLGVSSLTKTKTRSKRSPTTFAPLSISSQAEVDALRQQLATTLTEATTILTTMGRYAERQWDQFLHHTDAGRALNQVGQIRQGGVSRSRWADSLKTAGRTDRYGNSSILKAPSSHVEGTAPRDGPAGRPRRRPRTRRCPVMEGSR